MVKTSRSGLVYMMASLFVLFTNILENPQNHLADNSDNDLLVIQKIVKYVQQRIYEDENCSATSALFELMVQLEKVAQVKVERAAEDAVRNDFLAIREQLRRGF